MRLFHCTWALLLAFASVSGAQPARPAPTETRYSVFLGGTPVGGELVTMVSDAAGTTVISQGRISAPQTVTIRRAEFRYNPDGSPASFLLDANSGGADIALRTSFKDGNAVTEGTQAGKPIAVSHTVSPRAIVHANGVVGSYSALAQRLVGAQLDTELRLYVVPQIELPVRVKAIHKERMQIGTAFLDVLRYELAVVTPNGELLTNLTTTTDGGLIRVHVPAQGYDIVRADLAASTSRTQVYSHPGDEPVVIPAAGFNLGATLTRPTGGTPAVTPTQGRFPAVVLLAGSGVGDRDGFGLGVPTLGQLAGGLADAGFITVRYDKRGAGQSGGRAESATLADYAEDVRTVVRWLANRKDVDARRIAVVGHGEGAWVALLAATREKRIAAVASIAGASVPGAELVLEQQQQALDRMTLSPAEREARVALQKQIQSAALTGKGWEGVPAELRRQADTPWFQSLLAFNPAKVLEDVRQPLLFVHGELDKQVPVAHADRLGEIAKTKSDSKSVDVVVVRGINHLMTPATTGDVSEYGTLQDRNVSGDVVKTVATWLARTLTPAR